MTEVVVVVSRDPVLSGDVRRLCAVAGQPVQVCSDDAEVVRAWRSTCIVVIDAAIADSIPVGTRRGGGQTIVVADQPDAVPVLRSALRLGASHVLSLPADEQVLLDLVALAGEASGPPGPVIGVVGASGGIGTSTVATSLAWVAAAHRRDVVLVDFDMAGGGLDLPLGLEGVDGLRWPDLTDARGVVSSGALRASLPGHDRLRVLAAGRSGGGHEQQRLSAPPAEAVAAVLDAGRRGGGLVVADLGRLLDVATGSAAHSCDNLVLVVATEVRSVAAAAILAPVLHRVCPDLRLVVRAGARGRLRPRDVGEALGLSAAVTIESEAAIAAAADRGELSRALGRGSYSEVARVLADVLDPRQAA